MPPDPPRGYRLRRAFIRTPLRQILDPPQNYMHWASHGSWALVNTNWTSNHRAGWTYKILWRYHRCSTNLVQTRARWRNMQENIRSYSCPQTCATLYSERNCHLNLYSISTPPSLFSFQSHFLFFNSFILHFSSKTTVDTCSLRLPNFITDYNKWLQY